MRRSRDAKACVMAFCFVASRDRAHPRTRLGAWHAHLRTFSGSRLSVRGPKQRNADYAETADFRGGRWRRIAGHQKLVGKFFFLCFFPQQYPRVPAKSARFRGKPFPALARKRYPVARPRTAERGNCGNARKRADRWRREAGIENAEWESSFFGFPPSQYPRSSARSAKIRGKQLPFAKRAQ
jgi:hypothetical protein